VKRVEEKFVRTSVVMELVVRGRSIKTTVEHPFYVLAQNDFVPAGQIKAGDHLISHDGELVQVDAVHSTDEVTTVYNLRVADHHTYFVGGTIWGRDVWVHNASYAGKVLKESEQLGGHALAKHLAKTDGYLKARVRQGLNLATTFRSHAEMEAAVGELLASAGGRIKSWVRNTQLLPPVQMKLDVKLSKKWAGESQCEVTISSRLTD